MELNYSNSPLAIAQREYRILHPELKSAANKRYCSTPNGKAVMKHCKTVWMAQNREYAREYSRLYQRKRAALKKNDLLLVALFDALLTLHKTTLTNRKGPMTHI